MNFTSTICPYCGCGCGLNLVTVDGKIKGVEPWKRSPVNEGNSVLRGIIPMNSSTTMIGLNIT